MKQDFKQQNRRNSNRPASNYRPGSQSGRFDQKNRYDRNDRNDRMNEESAEGTEGLLEGRNALQEALKAGRTIDKVYVASGDTNPGLARLASAAKEAGAVIVPVDRRKLDQMSITHAHQGVIAQVAAHEYASLEDILNLAKSRNEEPLIVICDELSDPHNLGAIMRSAECAGAHGVVIPKRRSVGLSPIVAKASAGAIEYMPVARVANISNAIKELQKAGVWVFGAAAEGSQVLYDTDFKGATAIVIGNEGDGIGRLVRDTCDALVSVPMKGNISSLNASATAAILLYEALRQRR